MRTNRMITAVEAHAVGEGGRVITGGMDQARASATTMLSRPNLCGQGWIAGVSQYLVDPPDPFHSGFTVRDTWAN